VNATVRLDASNFLKHSLIWRINDVSCVALHLENMLVAELKHKT